MRGREVGEKTNINSTMVLFSLYIYHASYTFLKKLFCYIGGILRFTEALRGAQSFISFAGKLSSRHKQSFFSSFKQVPLWNISLKEFLWDAKCNKYKFSLPSWITKTLIEFFFQGNILLRLSLYAKPPLNSWYRSTFNEVNDWTHGQIFSCFWKLFFEK